MKTRLASIALLAACLTGCAAPGMSTGSPASAERAPATKGSTGASTGSAAAPQSAARDEGTVSNNSGGLVSEGAPMASPTSAPGAGAAIAPGEPNPGTPAQPPTQEALKAGSVDDNAAYPKYLAYLADFDWDAAQMKPRRLDATGRHVLRVVDAAGHGVANATVVVKAGETPIATLKTYADGRALFHPKAYKGLEQATSLTLAASKGDLSATATGDLAATDDWSVALAGTPETPAAKLDMAIVLDTTGSMGGEIRKFQDTIAAIATRIRALPQQPAVRLGLVAYKDQREQYVTRVTPFTADTAAFELALDQLSAGGGGDKPEDLEAGLAATLNELSWDAGDAVRLSFVVTDAAPHTDYPQSTPYTDAMQMAAEKGIKLYGVGASSLEAEGEYALRQLAQWTMGKYLFVTRGGDEATGGGGTASATVDKFREGRLDDIVVDIVKAELEQLGK